jgi:hypothetical protein
LPAIELKKAAGRPVIAQETGFSRYLPIGEGLFSFNSIDDIRAATAAMNCDYSRHARAARQIAEEYFASDRVLTRLLERVRLQGEFPRNIPSRDR